MHQYFSGLKHDHAEKTHKMLKEYEEYDDPNSVKMMYKYNIDHDHEYARITNEVTEEYKTGMLDPTRTVGKVERRRGAVRKQIEAMKRKYARMGK
jgi:hypothetical protein